MMSIVLEQEKALTGLQETIGTLENEDSPVGRSSRIVTPH